MNIQNIKICSRILYSNMAIFVSILLFIILSAYQIYKNVKTIETLYYYRIIPLQQLGIIQRNILQIRINIMAEMIFLSENNLQEVKKRIEYSDQLNKVIDDLIEKFSKTNLAPEERKFNSMV